MKKMKKLLPKIWKFLNSKVFQYVLIIISVVIIINMCDNNSNLKKKNNRKDQNISALNDTIKNVRKKNGNLQSSINGFVTTIKELKYTNNKLYNKVKEQEGNIVTLSSAVIELKQDTSELRKYIRKLENGQPQPVQVNDSTFDIPWKLEYNYPGKNWDKFNGITTVTIRDMNFSGSLKFSLYHKYSELIERESNIELTFGQKYLDDKIKVFVESKYPGFKAKNLSGVMLNPQKIIDKYYEEDKWFGGISFSIGASVYYNVPLNKPVIVIGPSIGIDIYEWSW